MIIERDEATCKRLAANTDALIIHGDACDFRFQQEARVDKADVFASVTGDDDDNLVACQLAMTSFNVPRTVARVNNPKNERIFSLMGIDAISSTTVIGHLIEEESTVGDIVTLHLVKSGKLAIVEVEIPETGARSAGKAVQELSLPEDCVLVSVIRGEEVIIPGGGLVLEAGDAVIAVTSLENEEKLKRALLE